MGSQAKKILVLCLLALLVTGCVNGREKRPPVEPMETLESD
jgi:hypothetical protein